jgi:hypothetical protein
MAIVYEKRIIDKISRSSKVKAIVEENMKNRFKEARSRMLNEFNTHPVTREILGGGDASNISGTLSGRGNLWGFLGFEVGSDPIGELDYRLFEKLNYYKNGTITVRGNFIGQRFRVSTPDIEEIYDNTILGEDGDGIGMSWVEAVENGVNGLDRFIYWEPNRLSGRSEAGIQASRKIRSAKFSPVPYVSKILENFRERVLE